MRRILAAAAALLLAAVAALVARSALASAPSCPQVIAHRTLMNARPENTVAGIQAVPATGATAVEMDVQWSTSGFPVLMHDPTVDRTTNGTGAPSAMSLGALRALSAAAYAPWQTMPPFGGFNPDGTPRTPVPYGYEFMQAVASAGLDVLLHINATPTQLGTQKLRTYVADYFGWTGRSLVMASAEQVAAMHAWEPGLRYGVIEYNSSSTIRRGESILAAGAQAYVVPARDVSPAAVAYWHAYGLTVYSWSSDSPSIDVPPTWDALADAGVDVLITNEPAAALAEYAERCAAPGPSSSGGTP